MFLIFYRNNKESKCESCYESETKMRQRVTKLEANGNEVYMVYTGLGRRVM